MPVRFFTHSSRPSRKTYGRLAYRPDTERLEIRECLSGGLLDPTFNGTGSLLSDKFSTGSAVAVQADSKTVIVGNNAVTRLKVDGSIDTTFGGGDGQATLDIGVRSTYAFDVLIQPDGKILVCGQAFTNKSSANESEYFVARLTAAGALDTSFGKKGVFEWNPRAGRESANGMARLADGSIVVGGSSDFGYGFTAFKLTSAGARVTSFGTNGEFSYNFGGRGGGTNALAIAPNGSIVLAGGTHQGSLNGRDIGAIVTLTSAGSLDTTFNGTGTLEMLQAGMAWSGFSDVAIQGSRLIVGGTYATSVPDLPDGGFAPRYGIVSAYGLTGAPDMSFGAGGSFTSDAVGWNVSVKVAADSSIVVGGSQTYGLFDSSGNPLFDENGTRVTRTEGAVAHLTAGGVLDTTFGTAGTGVVSIQLGPDYTEMGGLALAPDGRIVLCGFTFTATNQRKGAIVRLTAP